MQEKNISNVETIGDRIRWVRKYRLHMSQTELAQELGMVRYNTVARYEKNERRVSITILDTIARIGGVSVDWLLTGKNKDSVDTAFCERFKSIRFKFRLKPFELAERLETTTDIIDRIERHEMEPPGELIEKVIKLFNISPVWFFCGPGTADAQLASGSHRKDALQSMERAEGLTRLQQEGLRVPPGLKENRAKLQKVLSLLDEDENAVDLVEKLLMARKTARSAAEELASGNG